MFGRRNAVDDLVSEFASYCMSPEWGSDPHTRTVEFYRRKERRLSEKDKARLRAAGQARQTLAAATGNPLLSGDHEVLGMIELAFPLREVIRMQAAIDRGRAERS